MATPEPNFDIIDVVPLRYKPFVGLIGSLLTLAVPYLVTVETSVPAPWPVVIGVVLAVATALGVDRTPYKPKGTVLVQKTPAVVAAASQSVPPASVVTSTMASTPTTVFRSGPPWK